MEAGLNPFTPGSGTHPPELVGRTAELERCDLLVVRAKKRVYERSLMLHGLRGVGKTTLLATMADMARRQGWMVVEVEAQTSQEGAVALRRRIARDLDRAIARRGWKRAVLKRLRQLTGEFAVSASAFGVGVTISRADSENERSLGVELEDLVEELSNELRKDAVGLGLFIDEMQELETPLLQVILAVQHRAAQRGWPFFVFGAGLPHLPQVLADARSYAERQFDYRTIGPVTPDEALEAIAVPVGRLGQGLTEDAADYIVRASGGYPYFLQVLGYELWKVAECSPFSLADAVDAVESCHESLDSGFYSSRWSRTTDAERRYLTAMATCSSEPIRSGSIAGALGLSAQSAAPHRDACIKKGLIYAPERGVLDFTVPGMDDFIRRQI